MATQDGAPQTFVICITCPVEDQDTLLAGLHRFGKHRIVDDGLSNAATVAGGSFSETLY